MKICEKCGKPATILYQESINGKTRELCLCAACAGKMGVGVKSATMPGFFDDDLMPLFSDLFAAPAVTREERCPACGKTVRQIQKDGKFGCSRCYESFGKNLDLKPFVGSGYRGEPLCAPAGKEQKEEDPAAKLEQLKAQLKQVLAAEEYEKAAALRDQIRAMEGK